MCAGACTSVGFRLSVKSLTRMAYLPTDPSRPSCHFLKIPAQVSLWLVRHFALILNLNPFPAIRSSCVLDYKDSARCLVDLWDSTTQPYNVLTSFPLPIFGSAFALSMVKCCLSILSQGMSGATSLSSLLRAFFENFWILFVIWIDKVTSSQFSSIVKFWLFFCPFLFFSILSRFTNFRPYFWTYIIWSRRRLIFCHSSPGPHISFFGSFSFNRMNFVNPVQESEKCLLESTSQ